jgi:hypothetical protein
MQRPQVVLFFLDGVGIGEEDPSINPFFRAELPVLRSLLGGPMFHKGFQTATTADAMLLPVSATLGVAGLPQSGTGQTSIFTGVNAARQLGRHQGPFPPTDLRPVIREKNIFTQLMRMGRTVAFANAFPKQFFEYTQNGTRRLTVTTLACSMAGMPLRTADDLRTNNAVSADITRMRWVEMGYPDLPEIPGAQAGEHLARMSASHDFTLFEYWLTDHAGHKMNMPAAVDILQRFDAFLGGFLRSADPSRTISMIISDHGNVEDLSTKGHTRNPVPFIVMGRGIPRALAKVRNLGHITPAIVRLLT